ncbi:MAG: hypothetical protein ABRQ37_27145 [Candidatus Eremiobacterota bacterium]
MAENTLVVELAKFVGFPIVLFIIWICYHRSTMRIFEKIVDKQYTILKDLIEVNNCTIGALARIEQKIDSNTWCPYTRERMKEVKKNE